MRNSQQAIDIWNRKCISQERTRLGKDKEPHDMVITVGGGNPNTLMNSVNGIGMLLSKNEDSLQKLDKLKGKDKQSMLTKEQL